MTSKSILVVDDDPNMLLLAEITLKRRGFTVQTADSPYRALDILSRDVPDLIILDVMMAGMDGTELCRRIRANPATAQTPVIMWSAFSSMTHRQQGLEAGANDYVSKTGPTPNLINTVRKFLDFKQNLIVF